MQTAEQQNDISKLHQPVLLQEVLHYWQAADITTSGPQVFIDCTLGLGGHTERLLEISPQYRVLAFERDTEAIALACQRLARFGDRFVPVHTDFRQIKTVLKEMRAQCPGPVAGILADLGVSSLQLDSPERGFSFRFQSAGESATEPPLDMRLDRSSGLTAAQVVNTLRENELADLIYHFGEERAARKIARQIVVARAKAPLTTTAQLAALVVKAVHQKGHWRIHPATRTFQALRIYVNRELEGLDEFVADAVTVLTPHGRLVMITFHSLEDRIIKQAFRFQSGICRCPSGQPECRCGASARVEVLTRKAIVPSEAEIAANPRARSAKLRACRKL